MKKVFFILIFLFIDYSTLLKDKNISDEFDREAA